MALNTQQARIVTVWWKDLDRWDVKFFSARIHSSFPIVKLGPLVFEHREFVKPFESPDTTFRILGVTNTDGIFHAYDCLGKKINQHYQRVSAGDFAYNPYRINVGSIGIVPPELGNNYISPAYVVFATDTTYLLPEYLLLVLKADWFNPMLRAATAGSVRQNLTFDLLKTLEIPLPTINEQKNIIAQWSSSRNEITAAHELVEKKKNLVVNRFLADLGLRAPDTAVLPKAFSVLWKDFPRWGVNLNLLKQSGADLIRSIYPVRGLGSLLTTIQYGTSEKAGTNGDGTAIIRMNNIVDGQLDITDLKYVCLPKKEADKLTLGDGDILINRTNSKELVGKCAVFHLKGQFIFASYLIRIRADSKQAVPDFLAYFINSPLGRQQLNALSRQIIGQANINSKEIRSLQIPLPRVETQRNMMKMVTDGMAEITREWKAAEKIRANIKSKIETWILSS